MSSHTVVSAPVAIAMEVVPSSAAMANVGDQLPIAWRILELEAITGLLDDPAAAASISVQCPPPAIGRTVLHMAVINGSCEQLKESLKPIPLMPKMENVVDSRGCTPMMMAAARNAPQLIVLLFRHHYDLDFTILPRRETPLHIAAALGMNNAVEHLLVLGADPKLRTTDGFTAQDLAEQAGFVGCAAMIRSALGKPPYVSVTAAQLRIPEQKMDLAESCLCNASSLGARYGCVGGYHTPVASVEFSGTQTTFVLAMMNPSTACGNWVRSLLNCMVAGTLSGCLYPTLCLAAGGVVSCCQCGREVTKVVVEQPGAKATITWKRDTIPPDCAAEHTLEDEVDFVEQIIYVIPELFQADTREPGEIVVHFKKKLKLNIDAKEQFSYIRLAAMLGVPAFKREKPGGEK